jgi:hypothetical protein
VKWLGHDGASLKLMKRDQAIRDLFALSELEPELAATARRRTSRPIHISGYHREANDFYATPDWVTEALLSYVQFRGRVWEPCCGTGAITTVLQRHGYGVTSTDIADHGFGTPGVDFLLCGVVPDDCRALVTNPPYGGNGASREGHEKSAIAMLRFVDRALRLTESVQGQLALLVRFQWVAGRRAAALISAGPLAAVIALTHRIQWFDKREATNISQHHHAWIVFDHAHPAGKPPSLLFAGHS